MNTSVTLRGMTWAHTRGFLPMVATAQRFQELHPDVKIVWEKRSLGDFEECPVQDLAAHYDLVVIDHPFAGCAASHGIFLPLDDLLPAGFLDDQAAHSVGGSHASYQWENRQWALAIDAATPVAAWRPDLLAARHSPVPRTWDDVLALAIQDAVEVPATPINCLMNFYGLCASAGEAPFAQGDYVVSRATGLGALERLSELVALCPVECLTRNPIQSLEILASAANTTLAYCLFPYGYSNYAREGYATYPLVFGDLPMLVGGRPLITTLGGTGLAISARTSHPQIAAEYAAFVACETTQRTLYVRAGGQPGHRAAWLDAENNRLTNEYFSRTLPALDRSFLRPRYDGYLKFQKHAALVLHTALQGKLVIGDALAQLDALYRASLVEAPSRA